LVQQKFNRLRVSPAAVKLCMMRGHSGIFIVNSTHRPASLGWAMVLLAVTTLTLAGCGRKGGLDLPPSSSAAPVASVEEDRAASPGTLFAPQGADLPPAAARGSKRGFILDPLLN
jgi:predicted small lipoprotein YifL